MQQQPMDKSSIELAKAILKEHKREKKKKVEDEKKKADAKKPRTYTFMELTGAIFLFSIPVVLTQVWLISYAQVMMNALLK